MILGIRGRKRGKKIISAKSKFLFLATRWWREAHLLN